MSKVTRTHKWLPRIGPGLLLAVVASVFVWHLMPEQRSDKPGIEHNSFPSQANAVGLSAPDPAWLASRQESFGLTSIQRSQLAVLKERWDKDTAGLQSAMKQAAEDYARSATPPAGQGATLQQIREQTTPVSDLTHQLLGARQTWWREASQVLTDKQCRQVEQAWAARFKEASATPPGGPDA